MSSSQLFEWESDERRFLPRLMTCIRFTGLEGELKGWLDGDLRDIGRAIGFASEKREVEWQEFLTSREIPVPNLEGMSNVDRRRTRLEILEKNRRAADNSDCLIAHAWANGSTMLGEIQASFLRGPILRPVIVLRYKGNRSVSLGWEALAEEHPQLQILDFEDDLLERLGDKFAEIADSIEASSGARASVEEKWRPICGALSSAIGREPQETRVELAARIGLTDGALHSVVTNPMRLAALPSSHSDLLRLRYGPTIRAAIVTDAVSERFTPQELEAFKEWALKEPRARSLSVIEREVALRETAGIYNPRPRRTTPASWAILARELGA